MAWFPVQRINSESILRYGSNENTEQWTAVEEGFTSNLQSSAYPNKLATRYSLGSDRNEAAARTVGKALY